MDANKSPRNPFSIDYILSSSAAATQPNNNLDHNLLQQPPTNSMAMPETKDGQQAHPNFLYFMACMLIQQQQQQQLEQRQQLQQQLQHHQQQQQQQQQRQQQQQQQQLIPKGLGPNPLNLLNHQRAHHNNHSATLMNNTLNHKSNHLLSRYSLNPNNNNSGGSSSSSQQFLNKTNHGSHCGSSGGGTQSSNGDKLDNLKPAHSYIGLIAMCILSSPEKRMVLNDIYQFILDNYPYYRNRGSGWRNSVRHNLSLNECFQKAARAANGKGHYWTIHPANMEDFMMGDFRRRRAQRKVRRWNHMDVPSDESDDESIEDATKPPLPEHFKRSLEMHRQIELKYQESAKATQAALAAVVGQSPLLNLPPPPSLQQRPPPPPPQLPIQAPHSSGPCSPVLFRKQ